MHYLAQMSLETDSPRLLMTPMLLCTGDMLMCFGKLKGSLIGLEAALKRNVKIIDDFIFELIQCKREQMKNERLVVSKFHH